MKNLSLKAVLLASGFVAGFVHARARVDFTIDINGTTYKRTVILKEGQEKNVKLSDQYSVRIKNVEETAGDALFIYTIQEKELGTISEPTIRTPCNKRHKLILAVMKAL